MKLINFFKSKKILILIAVLCVETAVFNSQFFAQNIEVKIKLMSVSPARVSVEGRFLDTKTATKDWSFLQNYADVTGLAERIENLKMLDELGNEIKINKLSSGEFEANQVPVSWKYDVKTAIPSKLTDAAHVSWMSENQGLLMLEDLLPQFKNKPAAKIIFDFPNDWKISSSETVSGNNSFKVNEIEKAVFLIGKNWREKTAQVDKTTINLALTGNWLFTDDEASETANSILREYRKNFGEIPNNKVEILLLPFPQANADADRWRAETRGSTVVVISGLIPFKSQAIQRLNEQLRHEIFHLWIPNAVNLSGNYDWFYEGFTIYHALRTGVELNQIRFEDFLNTLARGYDLTQWMSESQNISLIEASSKRWENANNFVYAKGLIVAFLCDAAMLRESKGKRSLKDVFRRLYQKHQNADEIQDGNTAILDILKSYPELQPIVQNYIKGKSKIDWQNDLAAFGIDFEGRHLKVSTKLDNRQKDLLDKLGYNQWRKLLEKK